jgi:fructose/tagatose bisphosphate aldolase
MIDGSHLPYEGNITLTKQVVEYANQFDVSVEGELGVLAGIEEHVVTAIVRKVLMENPKEFDPRKYLGPARKELIEMIKHKNTNVLGSANRA